MVGLPSPSGSEKDLQLNFGKNMTVQVEMRAPHLPAEWHMQSGIQLTWPHVGTDWAYMLAEVQECFINIAREIAKRELLLIVTPEPVSYTHLVFIRIYPMKTGKRQKEYKLFLPFAY